MYKTFLLCAACTYIVAAAGGFESKVIGSIEAQSFLDRQSIRTRLFYLSARSFFVFFLQRLHYCKVVASTVI